MTAATLIGEFVLLFQMACVIFLFTYLFAKSRFYARVLEHKLALGLQLFLAVVFGLLSVYGMETGITFYTAHVNIRDFGPLAGGLACGPVVGIGAGIIGMAYRFMVGGTNVYAVAVAPLIVGVAGGLIYQYTGKELLPTLRAALVALALETFVSLFALGVRYFSGDSPVAILTVGFNVALPMTLMTTLSIAIFCIILHNQESETRIQKEKLLLEVEVESRKNLGTIINRIAYPVYVLDRNHRFILVNESLCGFMGRECSQVFGKTHRDFYDENQAGHHWKMVEKVFSTGEAWEEELTITRPNGEVSTIQSAFTMYRDAAGQEFLVGVIHDITEITAMQEELAKREEWYRTLFEHTGAATVILNKEGMIEHANSQFAILSGYSRDEIEGKKGWQNFVHPEDYERVLNYHTTRRIDPESVPSSYTQRIIPRSGEERTLQTLVGMIPGTSKSIVSFIDITEQKRIEEALKLANRKLNLLSSITRHDILNQLLILRGYLSLLIQNADTQIVRDYSSKSYRATENIERQILFTRDYQDMGVHAPVWQNLGRQVIAAKGELAPTTLSIITEKTDVEILADPLFPRIFYNLMENSLRYGGEKLSTIRITTENTGIGLLIRYQDNGVGLTDEEKAHLFERGFGKHTGFGLFLSREILAITGITINETGEKGNGARFDIFVPNGMWRTPGKR